MIPKALAEIVALFEQLPEQERRENLAAMAEAVCQHEPREGEHFEIRDVRKDSECTDAVGIFLKVNREHRLHFAVTLGPRVQTLTRAMATILCRGLDGTTATEVLGLPDEFVPRIIGTELVRQRSRTVYYMLRRIKAAVSQLPPTPEKGGGEGRN